MGCSESKSVAKIKKGKIVWFIGYPCAGKTFMGDYLATIGWHMIDGDRLGYSSDPKAKILSAQVGEAVRTWV